MSRKIKTILIDTNCSMPIIMEIEDKLDAYYEALNCTCFDITKRRIGGKYYNIMCDDEGWFVENPIPTVIDQTNHVEIVGNIMLFNDDGQGELTSLTKEDIDNICHHMIIDMFLDNNKVSMLTILQID